MPTYWENPSNPGVQAIPPAVDLDSWAHKRPFHLADEIVRAETEVLATRESVTKLVDKGAPAHKIESASRYQGEVEKYWKALRAQAATEFPDTEEFQRWLETAATVRRSFVPQVSSVASAGVAVVEPPAKKRRWFGKGN